MSDPTYETCPGCGALLPRSSGPTHRYIGASPACWGIFTALANAGKPPLAPDPFTLLLTDAYAVQHPGTPSEQAIQSVAVHLLTLYGVLVRDLPPGQALWLRKRALRGKRDTRRERFYWLEPPAFAGSITVADIVQATTPATRTAQAKRYINSTWETWASVHKDTVVQWYTRFVLPDQF